MNPQTWGQRLGTGALAGLGGGVVSAVLFWLLLEPSINRAIAIEETGSSGGHAHSHGHGASSEPSHHAGEVVTRFQQQLGGTFTVLVVAVLFGLAFSVVYARSEHRMAGRTALGRSLCLAALALGALVLMPALVIPANPPAVGDPGTVDQRTLTYLLTILLSVLAVGLVNALTKALEARSLPTEWRWLLTSAGAAVAVAVVIVAVPSVSQDVPTSVPADLIWQFRIGSLAQLVGMWAAIGVIHGFRTHRLGRMDSGHLAQRQTLA